MRPAAAVLALLALAIARPAAAWGDLGHEVIASIAWAHLDPAVKREAQALLATDADTLTAPDFLSRSTWADKWAKTHHETSPWHFANVEIDKPDLTAACYGFPATPPGEMASQGPAQDCVVNKINEFSDELKNRSLPVAERELALKYLVHFIGDLHQPLHMADDADHGGNCIALSPSPDGDVTNLHLYWDVTAVRALGASAPAIAQTLDAKVTPAEAEAWTRGGPKDWAMETFALGKRDAYDLPSRPTCAAPGAITLGPAYQAMAKVDTARQLEIAGRRLASVLNRDLAPAAP